MNPKFIALLKRLQLIWGDEAPWLNGETCYAKDEQC